MFLCFRVNTRTFQKNTKIIIFLSSQTYLLFYEDSIFDDLYIKRTVSCCRIKVWFFLKFGLAKNFKIQKFAVIIEIFRFFENFLIFSNFFSANPESGTTPITNLIVPLDSPPIKTLYILRTNFRFNFLC